ncbi:methyltransferase domain-containing protein [Pontibacillus yanchengensis]|uniref:Methyltransferase domain-containing protein n=1 Tax=Pontibacillus yanchengensis TaxID=462910 RepID=A0ACC7VKG0_9BACI|nr:class I SAM-dependent methyltransferase [Pontibacillus yanchengensis]MYL55461.1 methyltransferase domain-containing protein [Pontibacillus yanchengensis]
MNKKQTERIKQRYNRISSVFDLMDHMIRDQWREDSLQKAYGEILEVGVGTGTNLKYYNAHAKVTGIDFSPNMLEKAKQKASRRPGHFELLEMDAQNLDFNDDTFDTVVSTCVFCSVPDPIQGLKEIRRVTKPTGQIIMLEHMRSDVEWVGNVMDILNPIGLNIIGANINRRTMENIEMAGLKVTHQEQLMSSIMRRITLSPNKK